MTPRAGTLLQAEEIPPDVPGSRAWRVRFASRDLAGRPTESTGIVAAPVDGPADRPVVVWCHGTTGLGDASVPSRQPNPAGELITYPEPVGPEEVDRGVPGMADYLAAGAVVVAPDYQGLGTEGFHHYCVHATGARDAVNAVRSAGRLAEAGAGTRVGVLGWSEGGGMALGVPELPADELADLDLRAVATFAPGVPALAFEVDRSTIVSEAAIGEVHVMMLVAAHGWLFDDLDPLDLLAPAVVDLLDRDWNRVPSHLLATALARLAAEGPVLAAEPRNVDRWAERLRSASAGRSCPAAPVYVATATTDTTVPPSWQQAYVEAAVGFGGNVTREDFPGDGHCDVPFTASATASGFLLDHLAGP